MFSDFPEFSTKWLELLKETVPGLANYAPSRSWPDLGSEGLHEPDQITLLIRATDGVMPHGSRRF